MGKSSSRFKVSFEDYHVSKRLASDEQLEENLRYYEELEREKLQILLLGTDGVGKSTFLRQLRMIHGDLYTEEELVEFISIVHQNLIFSMKILLQQAKSLHILGGISSRQSVETIIKHSTSTPFLSDSVLRAISLLWSDPVIKSVWNLRDEFQIDHNVGSLFDKCTAIATPGYIPQGSDILHCSLPTSGVKTRRCDVLGTAFEIYDIGFRRSSKSEWVQFFSTAKAIIFIVDLTHFDQSVTTDKNGKNKMVESAEHFGSICNNPAVRNSTVIILMNKIDLFTLKLRQRRVRDVPSFSEYRGNDSSSSEAVNYFLQKHINKISSNGIAAVSHFVTNFLDSESTSEVILGCKSIIENRTSIPCPYQKGPGSGSGSGSGRGVRRTVSGDSQLRQARSLSGMKMQRLLSRRSTDSLARDSSDKAYPYLLPDARSDTQESLSTTC